MLFIEQVDLYPVEFFPCKKKAEDKSQSAGNAKNVIMMVYYGIDVFQDKRIIRVLILKLKGVNSRTKRVFQFSKRVFHSQ